MVELEAGVNTNNDRESIIDLTDDAIEDQGNGFLFWPSRDDGAEVTAAGIVDLMPARFALPQSLLTAGFLPYVRMVGPQNSRIDLYRNEDQADNTAYVKDASVGPNQVAASRLVALESDSLLPMSQADEQWLLKFPSSGVYTLYLGIETPGGGRLVGDSVRVTVRDPSALYWYGSARGDQSVAFAYPVDSPGYVTVQRFPDVALVGDDNRDWTKQKHLVFLHGFNNNTGEAREWNNEMFKRLYWTGYRDNYLGITWFGDEGPDILPVLPDVEEYNFPGQRGRRRRRYSAAKC